MLWEHDVAGSVAARECKKTTDCCFPSSVTEPAGENRILSCRPNLLNLILRDVAQLVARVLWEHDVAGSNPVIPTKKEKRLPCVTSFAFYVDMMCQFGSVCVADAGSHTPPKDRGACSPGGRSVYLHAVNTLFAICRPCTTNHAMLHSDQ